MQLSSSSWSGTVAGKKNERKAKNKG